MSLEIDLQKLVTPSVAESVIQVIESWKKTLVALVPQSYVEVVEKLTTHDPILFAWYFENKLANGAKQSGKVTFHADGKVEFNTQSGTELSVFKTFKDAENYFLKYFTFEPQKAPAALDNLMPFEERQKNYKEWANTLKKLEKFGVDVDSQSDHTPFVIWLPTMEKILTGKDEYLDDAFYLEPGEDWNKKLNEEIIPKLSSMYELSKTEIPDLNEILLNVKLSPNSVKLVQSIETWATWIIGLASKVPFSLSVEDVFSTLSNNNCWFDGIGVVNVPDVMKSNYRGIIKADFSHAYLFNENELPIKIFSGSLIYFEENKAVLNFSGVPVSKNKWRVHKTGEEFIYDEVKSMYAYQKNDKPLTVVDDTLNLSNFRDYLKPMTFTGTWEEVSFRFVQLISFIDDFMGEDINRFSAVSDSK